MVIYRPGVGRVYATRRHPFEVDSDSAPPHPGYDPSDGLAREAEIVERRELPSGLVIESYGDYKRSRSTPPEPVTVSEPEAPRSVSAPAAKDWRKDFGLSRNG